MAGEPDLDPGPRVWGEVVFVDVAHPDIEGVASIPEHLLDHHRQRGWELTDSAPVVEDPPKSTPPKRPSARTQEK